MTNEVAKTLNNENLKNSSNKENKKNGSTSKFLSNSLILFACAIVAKIIGAVYKIPLLKIIGSSGLGEYQIIFSIFALFLVISNSGITVTISKLISREETVKNYKNQKVYFLSCFFIGVIESLIFSTIFVIVGKFVATNQSSGSLFWCYLIIMPSILLNSISSCFRGYFLGKQKMIYSGFSQVVGAVAKLVFSLLLAIKFSAKGSDFALLGAILGVTISEIITTFVLLFLYFLRKKQKSNFSKIAKKQVFFMKKTQKKLDFFAKRPTISKKQAIKEIFSMSFFVKLQSCIFPLVGAIDSAIIIPILLNTGITSTVAYSLFGIEDGIVASLISMPTIISQSVGSAIIPSLKSNQNNKELLKNAIKIVWLFSIFSALIFIVFSGDIITFMYSGGLSKKIIDEFVVASDIVKINGFNIVYLCLLGLSTSILQGYGKTKIPFVNLFFALIARFVALLVCLKIKGFGIYSLAIADMVFYSVALILNFVKILKFESLNFTVKHMLTYPFVSGLAMLLFMKVLQKVLINFISTKVVFLVVLLTGFLIYVSFLIVTKVFDIKKLFGRLEIKIKRI